MATAFACAVLGPLASACVYDLRERRIPNKLTAFMAALWCAWCVLLVAADPVSVQGFMVHGLVGATVLGGGSLLLAWAFERVRGGASFGGGDVKLLFVLGLYLGVSGGLVCLLVACLAALALAHVVPRTRFANVPGSVPGQIPFAPALFIGALAACVPLA